MTIEGDAARLVTEPTGSVTKEESQLEATLGEHVRASFAGIVVLTSEAHEAIQEIARLCRREAWGLATWNCEEGLVRHGQPGAAQGAAPESVPDTQDPLSAIRSLHRANHAADTTVTVCEGLQRFLGAPDLIQAVSRAVLRGRQSRSVLVILAPAVELPPELERLFVVLDHDLPSRNQLCEIAEGVAEGEEFPEGVVRNQILDSAAGLTRIEAENAFSLAIVRHGRLDPGCIWELKARQIANAGLVRLHRGSERFADLGGLEQIKEFCQRALAPRDASPAHARARGILLLSPPGCGKSQFAKALGNEMDRPTVILDVGTLLGSLVGQSEANMRQALRTIDAMSPCVVFLDELEKGLAGASGSGQADSGVTSRVFGSLLCWLNDHTSDAFLIATCNDISRLPPEFTRAERFDGVFFVDLPNAHQKAAIWEIHTRAFGLDPDQPRPADQDWTGAEIRATCRLASLLQTTLLDASQHVVPVAVTAADKVESLRQWASGRCLAADKPGVYRRLTPTPASTRRRAIRDPGLN